MPKIFLSLLQVMQKLVLYYINDVFDICRFFSVTNLQLEENNMMIKKENLEKFMENLESAQWMGLE